jgi:hypothetical protein
MTAALLVFITSHFLLTNDSRFLGLSLRAVFGEAISDMAKQTLEGGLALPALRLLRLR